MDSKTRSELGNILTDQEKLLEILSKNTNALEEYPNLQSYLTSNNQKSVEYRKALREKKFTKEDYRDAILEILDWFGYETCTELNMDFVINSVAEKVGADIDAIKNLTVKDIGAENISRLLHMMGQAIYAQVDDKPSFPWEATKGQTNHAFWKKCHLAYDAMVNEGYSSHYKLNLWSQATIGVSCPQSFPKFARTYGDPRLIESWRQWAEWSDE
ncbi:hypothetical protein P7F88_10355 [Vibrio hannami]|uniref:hypothetical protein n=1 Tax=Vibrio hannami TaxID=2717094 RepID=UPI00240F256B|nr:hypothetical protein [Vibrio hannami]MDG3086492.1 hypothetical protein [Vibrio hannami]